MEQQKLMRFTLEDTTFIYRTNFAGDPTQDTFGDSRRKAKIVVNDEQQARDMTKAGFAVKSTKPGKFDDPDNFKPTYYVEAQLKYRDRQGNPVRYPPIVYLVTMSEDGRASTRNQLSEDDISMLDKIRVGRVDCVLGEHRYDGDRGPGKNFYIQTLYVYQVIDDPFDHKFRGNEEAPF